MTKKAGNHASREIRAAWKRAQQAWGRVEDSLAQVVKSDKALIKELRTSGRRLTRVAKADINSIVRTLHSKRKAAVREFDRITGHHKNLPRRSTG